MSQQFHLTEVETLSALQRQRGFIEGQLARSDLSPGQRLAAQQNLQAIIMREQQVRAALASESGQGAENEVQPEAQNEQDQEHETLFFLFHTAEHDLKAANAHAHAAPKQQHDPASGVEPLAAVTLTYTHADDTLHVHDLSILQAEGAGDAKEHVLSAIERYAAAKHGIREVVLNVPTHAVDHYRDRHGYEVTKAQALQLSQPAAKTEAVRDTHQLMRKQLLLGTAPSGPTEKA